MKTLAPPLIAAVGFAVAAGAFVGCAPTRNSSTPSTETSGEYIDDSVITAKVKAAILDEPSLKSLQIGVTTYKNVVQLSGFVDSTQSVALAGTVAARVQGVASVKNDLVVK